MKLKMLICLCLLFLAPGMPAKAEPPPIDYAALYAHVLKVHLRPRYQAVEAQTKALTGAIDSLCQAPDAPRLEAARAAFHGVSDAWQAIEHMRTGPATSLNAHARLNFWPDERDRVGKHLRGLLSSGDAGRVAPADFAQGSVAVQGLPALERLLFGDKALDGLKAADAPVTPCKVARAIAANIAAIAQDLMKAWAADPLRGSDAKKATADLFTNLAGGLGAVADMKIGAPLGEKTGRTWPKKAEQWRSDRSLRNIAIDVQALEDLFAAMSDGAGPAFKGTSGDKQNRYQFQSLIKEVKNIGTSMQAALDDETGRLRLKVAAGSLRDMRDLVIGSMTGPLGLILGFNSFDGD